MPMPSRTPQGINNYPHLFKGKILVWIEGPQDEPFWGMIFPGEWYGKDVRFKRAYGRDEIDKIIKWVMEGETDALATRDSEYDDIFPPEEERHPRVVTTGRHSIENYFFVPEVIDDIAATLSNLAPNAIQVGKVWEDEITERFQELLYLDCTAVRLGTGDKVMGDKCARFLKNRSWRPCAQKISKCIGKLDLPEDDVVETREAFQGRRLLFYMRGHFLALSVLHLVKNEVRNQKGSSPSLSHDALTGMCLTACRTRLASDPDLLMLQSAAEDALSHLVGPAGS